MTAGRSSLDPEEMRLMRALGEAHEALRRFVAANIYDFGAPRLLPGHVAARYGKLHAALNEANDALNTYREKHHEAATPRPD